ncbi:MAG: M14 family zinc carboxypeptidase [Flavisolibacter sp.]
MKLLKPILLTAVVILISLHLGAQEKYSQVKIFAPKDKDQRAVLLGLLQVDHFVYAQDGGLVTEISESDITRLKQTPYQFQILVPDVKAQLEELNSQYFSSLKAKKPGIRNRVSIEQPGSAVDAIIPTPTHFVIPSTFGGYWSFPQMDSIMNVMVASYPSICQKISIGKTAEGRDIWLMKVSDNVAVDEANEPEVLYMGLQHAREAIGGSSMIFFLEYLCENYATDLRIKNLVDNREIYIIPCFNPDGWEYNRLYDGGAGGMWRKNRSKIDSSRQGQSYTFQYGVDLNRNWGVDWANCSAPISGPSSSCGSSSATTGDDTYWGSNAFSEKETQAVRTFAKSHHLVAGFDQHSYGPYYSLPFGRKELHLGQMTVKGQNFYTAVPALMGTYNGMRAADSYDALGYEVAGGFKDWMLLGEINVGTKDTVWAMTGEGAAGGGAYGTSFWAPASQIVNLSKSMCYQNLQLAYAVGSYVDVQDIDDIAVTNATGNFNFSVKRLGLGNDPLTVTLVPIENVQSVGSQVVINSIPVYYDTVNRGISYTLAAGITNGQRIRYAWKVQTGGYSYSDTVVKFYNPTVLFSDDMEGAFNNNWTATSNVADNWNYTTLNAFGGTHSLTESPAGNYTASTTRTLTYKNTIDLSDNSNAYLTFWTKYRAENFRDKLQLQVSIDNSNWTPIAGTTTIQEPGTLDGSTINGKPSLTGIRDFWTKEVFDLSAPAFKTSSVHLRFVFTSDNDPSSFKFETDDGFYIDNLKVVKSTSSFVTLPVQFASFTGNLLTNSRIKLDWKANISSLDHFEVEKSSDGNWFTFIGTLGKNDACQFIDNSPFIGNNYYRLKVVDAVGTYTYSSLVNVVYKPSMLTLSIGPNPVMDELHVVLKSTLAENFRIQITDMNGRMVYRKDLSLSNETRTVNVKMSSFSGPVFLVKITRGDGQILRVQKIIRS